MARLHPAVLDGFVEHHGDRGRRGVAVVGQVAQHPFVGHREAIGHGVEDALVGLMQ